MQWITIKIIQFLIIDNKYISLHASASNTNYARIA